MPQLFQLRGLALSSHGCDITHRSPWRDSLARFIQSAVNSGGPACDELRRVEGQALAANDNRPYYSPNAPSRATTLNDPL